MLVQLDRDIIPGGGAAAKKANKRSPSAPRKELIQDRQAQAYEYKEHHEHNFMTLNEELTFSRKTIRDLEKIIAALKAERGRLRQDLLEKGQSLQHYKDIVNATPGKTKELQEQLLEMQKRVGERNETINAMKAEVVTAQSSQQKALEEVDSLGEELKAALNRADLAEEKLSQFDESILNAKFELDTAKKSLEALKKDYSEVIGSRELIEKRAAEDAARNNAEIERLTKRLAEVEARSEADLTKARSTAEKHQDQSDGMLEELNVLKLERVQQQQEIIQLQAMLAEVDVLREQIATFRDAKDHIEAAARERTSRVEAQLQTSKEESRELAAALEAMKDEMAEAQRHNAQMMRQLKDAHATELKDAAEVQSQKYLALQLEHGKTKGELVAARKAHDNEQQTNQQLQEHIAAQNTQQSELRHELAVSRERESVGASELDALRQHIAELEAVIARKDTDLAELLKKNDDLQEVADEAAQEMEVMEKELEVLREVQDDDDEVKVEWKRKYEQLAAQTESDAETVSAEVERQLALERAEIARLTAALAEQEARGGSGEAAAAEMGAEIDSLRSQLEAAHAARDAAQSSTSDRVAVAREEFDAERKRLLERLAATEAARTDMKVAMDAKDTRIKQLGADARATAASHKDALKAADVKHKRAMDAAKAEQEALNGKVAQGKEDSAKLLEVVRELRAQVAELQDENVRLRDMQLNW